MNCVIIYAYNNYFFTNIITYYTPLLDCCECKLCITLLYCERCGPLYTYKVRSYP